MGRVQIPDCLPRLSRRFACQLHFNMKFDEIYQLVGHVPFISKRNAKLLYEMIVDNRLANILELGIAHGTATCIMAAAVEELGGGSIAAVDLLAAADAFQPSAE